MVEDELHFVDDDVYDCICHPDDLINFAKYMNFMYDCICFLDFLRYNEYVLKKNQYTFKLRIKVYHVWCRLCYVTTSVHLCFVIIII